MSTKQHITAIANIFPQISSILEIQCGDGYDIENCQILQNKDIRYIGVDVRDEVIFDNRQYFRDEKNKIFINLDPSNEPLPTADIIIASGMAPYLPIANIWALLENVRDSGATYFAFDYSLIKDGLNSDVGIEKNTKPQARPINLCQAPFYFPKPLLLVSDEENNLIAIYRISEVSYFMDWHNDDVSKLRSQLFKRINEDFDFLYPTFAQEQNGDKMFEEMMVAFLNLNAGEHNQKYYYDEPYKTIINRINGLGARNNIFRLVYRSETEVLMKENGYEFITLENAIHAQVLAKDFIRWYFGLSLWID